MSFNLSKVTYRHRRDQVALQDFNVTIPAGKVTAVLGLSASGKTTLLNLLGLLLENGRLEGGRITYKTDGLSVTPTAKLSSSLGEATAGGSVFDYASLTAAERAKLRLSEFGFVLQSCYLLPHLSCADNIAMPLALQGFKQWERKAVVEALIKRVDDGDDKASHLARDLSRLAGEVSTGQKQRTALLRAVIHNPRVVFADEPVSNLDFQTTERVVRLLLDWKEGRLNTGGAPRARMLILVTHDVDLAWRLADYFLLLSPDHRMVCELLAKTDDLGPDHLRSMISLKSKSL